jgi:hypothetical protein
VGLRKYDASEIQVIPPHSEALEVRGVEEEVLTPFEIRGVKGEVLRLTPPAAMEAHRYFARHYCVCSCPRHDGVLTIFSAEGGSSFGLRDDQNTELLLDKSACDKLHRELRPMSCNCDCGKEVAVRVEA